MEHLCVGSYVRIMTSCAIPAERKFDPFCEKIMLSLCPVGSTVFSYTSADGYEVTYSYTNFNKIHSASQNLPTEVMQMALKKDARVIERYFIQTIIPAMEEARKKNAVLALKNVILKDATIADSTQLGTISNLTKNDLRNKNEFVLSEFLTDVFIYAVAKTDNMIEAAFTKSIKKNFYTAYNLMADTIKFYEVTKPRTAAAIPLTSKGKFDKVFTPVSSETLSFIANQRMMPFSLQEIMRTHRSRSAIKSYRHLRRQSATMSIRSTISLNWLKEAWHTISVIFRQISECSLRIITAKVLLRQCSAQAPCWRE